MIKLYTWGTPNGQKIPIALEELGLPYEVHAIDIGKGDQHDPEYRKINPNGKIPAIIDTDLPEPGAIFESGAILIHLAEKAGKLLPKDPLGRAQALAWLFWQVGGLGPMIGQWGFFSRQSEPNEPALKRYFDESMRLYGVLDGRLGEADYLAGEYSIADIANFTWAQGGLRFIGAKHPEVRERFGNVNRWIERIAERPAVQAGLKVPNG